MCVSSLICFTLICPLSHSSFLYQRGRPQREFSHFPLLPIFSLLFPPLRAERRQCLLLTLSYHLSPFSQIICLISILTVLPTAGQHPNPTFIPYFPNTSFYLLIISAAQSLSPLSLWSFDLHEITVQTEKGLTTEHEGIIIKIKLRL